MTKEQTFRSAGFFDREIDLTERQQEPLGIPAGVVSPAKKGPAFIPVTVGSFADFESKFGGLDPNKFGPYAVNEYLKHKTAVTFLRVLGAGANDTTTDIENTRLKGTVKNAGFKIEGTVADSYGRHKGAVQFLAAKHDLKSQESLGFPIFSDNDSFSVADNKVNLVRGMILLGSGTRMMVMDGDSNTATAFDATIPGPLSDDATLGASGELQNKFKIILSSSADGFSTKDGEAGLKIFTASLDPADEDYISKILNTDPSKFVEEEHLLYADFAVENEVATVDTNSGSVMILSGTTGTSSNSGDTTLNFRNMFGRFDTRFQTAKTTKFISQPYGTKEFDLFHFENLSDGEVGNQDVKISITNVRKSSNPSDEFGTFTVQVRKFDDTDQNPQVLEQYPNCDLNPASDDYVAKKIGDIKAYYNFDAEDEDERRIEVRGKYPNKSLYVRIVMNEEVEKRLIPDTALPFGFRGLPVLKTSEALTDTGVALGSVGTAAVTRLAGSGSATSSVTGSILPPVPFTFKVTKGAVSTSPSFTGQPGVNEIVDSRLYWGVKTTRVPQTGSLTNAVLNPNVSSVTNPLVRSLTKMIGIEKLDALVTGSAADEFNNNKFTLSNVALSNDAVADVTGSAAQHMREAAYIRNGNPDSNNYTIDETLKSNRVTLGTLINLTSSAEFNRFSSFAKFTNILYGGFDGLNILDKDALRMNDKASSSDTGGGANSSYTSPALASNMNGTGKDSNVTNSYRQAVKIMTDDLTVNTNILVIPGIRDSFVTDYAAERCSDNGLIFFIQDSVEYDENLNRLFDDDSEKPDVEKTSEQLETRGIDNPFAATYFPDVFIDDLENNRRVQVPPSIPVIAAIGFNDKVGFPWFAPAGFNRAALDFVSNVDVRLNQKDRDRLQDANINPIAAFPGQGNIPRFVIFGQETLQQTKSALNNVNIIRLLIEVRQIVKDLTRRFVFEQNTAATRSQWVRSIRSRMAIIQAQSGISSFNVIMDETNNSTADIESNRMNGRVEIVPIRTVDKIAVDFIITNSGFEFV